MKVKSRISSAGLFFLVVQTMIGVGVLSLPHQAYKAAGQNGWISIFISGLFIQLVILLIWFLCRRFPNLTLFDFSTLILGKILGNTINFLYIVYLLTIVSYVLIIFSDTIIRWIAPETPQWVFLIYGIVLLVYGCSGTIRSMVSLFSFLFIFILSLLFILLLVLQEPAIDIRYLFPIGFGGGWAILKSTKDIVPSFIGFETLLFYFAFMKQPKSFSAVKVAFSAVFFVMIFYMYIVIISTMSFSPAEIKLVPEPVLYMIRGISLHVIQRLDLVFLSIWGIIVAATVISYAFIGSMGISKSLLVKHKIAVILFAVFVFFVSIISTYYVEISTFGEWVRKLNMIFGIIIPIILLLIAIIFKREAESCYEEK
ncbi:GerAB/ArcD/ProY family transporter [Peribacillus frigoritolerans]|uniref:GerAB/ArcD/ProY family transporter n=1 Tax=Peribacillus frigoritolerans TaxID=450367 RepID=UPI00207A2A06|nr:GerAB/ArcD/ProY family transporter [Peribacillus frigoritolerans]USK64944.1 spore germination protein [Peribacillus frigoritolerans]